MDATPSHSHFSIAERQRWMATLAHSQPDDLNPLWDALHLNALEWKNIRPAETGLTQIQAHTGGSGQRFFLGDATLTRAVIQHLWLQLSAWPRQISRRALRVNRRPAARTRAQHDFAGKPD